MTRPTTEKLKKTLQELVTKYNETIQIQNTCKEQIIAIQAVLQDRELDGNSNTVTSEITED